MNNPHKTIYYKDAIQVLANYLEQSEIAKEYLLENIEASSQKIISYLRGIDSFYTSFTPSSLYLIANNEDYLACLMRGIYDQEFDLDMRILDALYDVEDLVTGHQRKTLTLSRVMKIAKLVEDIDDFKLHAQMEDCILTV